MLGKGKRKNMPELKPTKFFLAMKAFVRYDGKILILRESSNNSVGTNANAYDVPGGRMEPGEPFAQVLPREIKEETGLTASIGQPFVVAEWWPLVRGEQWHIVAVYFLAEAKTNQVQLSQDHDDYQWIDPLRFREQNLIKNIEPVFETYNHLHSSPT